jgi:hypothetical protein
MAIQHKLVITSPPGSTFISFNEWAETRLIEEEIPLWKAAQERQTAYIQAHATSLDLEAGVNVFPDQAAADASEGGDPEFLIFFGRYLLDTGYTAEKIATTI